MKLWLHLVIGMRVQIDVELQQSLGAQAGKICADGVDDGVLQRIRLMVEAAI